MKKILFLFSLLLLVFIGISCNEKEEEQNVGLTFSSGEVNVYVGETINVKPNVTGADGAVVLQYQLSSDIATIDDDGNLIATEVGTLVVTVTIKDIANVEAKVTVIVLEKEETEYTITLDANGGTGLSSNKITFKDGASIVLPIPTKDGYVFNGWYENDVLVNQIENKNYNLVAKWESSDSEVKVNYVLDDNAYLTIYETREDLIADLIVDIQSVKGKTYSLSYFEKYNATGFGIFVGRTASKTFFGDDEMRVKWTWLLECLKELREAEGYDTAVYDEVIENGYSKNDVAAVNIEMLGFICGKEYINDDDKSCDYTKPVNKNGFWSKMSEHLLENSKYQIGSSALDVLANAVKIGAEFEGWYTSSDFSSASKVDANTKLYNDVTLYAKFKTISSSSSKITFDYNGGVSEAIYDKFGNKLSTLTVSNYNGDFWSAHKTNIYISTGENDPKAKFGTRIYVGKDEYIGMYKVVAIQTSGAESSWPLNAEYVITISNEYSGTYDDKFTLSKVAVGNVLVFDKKISSITSSSVATVNFYESEIDGGILVEDVNSDFILPTPNKLGFTFEGWYDQYNNKYQSAEDFKGLGDITVYANWRFQDRIIGSYLNNSWVVSGEYIQLVGEYMSGNGGKMEWISKNNAIATVDENGLVRGVSEGLATIVVSNPDYPEVSFTFYVTVFNTAPTGINKLLVDSHNKDIFSIEDLIIGINGSSGTYYTDVIGSVSKLLFEDYVVHDDYYLSAPKNKTTLSANGIEFITVHYAADMTGNAVNGGRNLASYNKSCNNGAAQASWHYCTGNDGVWACQTEAYGAWHAGSSKALTWHATGIMQKSTDPEFAKITLGTDNYFYLNGQKTSVKNTTEGTKLNLMGLAFKVVGGEYYISGHYYNTDYKYISSKGGNLNSIGIETSCANGSDLWLTWQYTAQLCAKLLLKYNLPLTQMVGHHFFSGKWCPQPLIEHDMLIWWEYVELVRQQMELFKNYSNYELTFSSDSQYLESNGRVNGLPSYTECVPYTITYTVGSTTKSVTLASILPGTIA